MKIKISRALLSVLISVALIYAIFSVISLAAPFDEATTEPESLSPVVAENLDIDITVGENNIYTVAVVFTVNYNEPRYGVDYCIRYADKISFEHNDKTIKQKRHCKVYGISVEGDAFDTFSEDGCKVIRFGSKDGNRISGEKTYRFTYKYRMDRDSTKLLDYVYYSIYPVNREFNIEKSKVNITLPKEFDVNKVRFFGGAYGVQSTASMDYDIRSLTVSASLKEELSGDENVSAVIELDNGYFSGGHSGVGSKLLLALLILLPLAATAAMWYLFGREEKRDIVSSHLPPNGLTSADMGYIIDGKVNTSDLVSLLLYWASRGYIAIEQLEKEEFGFIKLEELPETEKRYERSMFHFMFRFSDSVRTPSTLNLGRLFGTAARLIHRHYEAVPRNRIFTSQSIISRRVSFWISLLPPIACFTLGSYLSLSPRTAYLFALIVPALLALGSAVALQAFDKKNIIPSKKYITILTIGASISAAAAVCALIAGAVYGLNVLLVLAALLVTAACEFLSFNMKSRTRQSSFFMREIMGLKQFISNALPEQVEELSLKEPSLFLMILPYAYAFGMLDKWAKKFERIELVKPYWFIYGDNMPSIFNSMIFARSINRFAHIISRKSHESISHKSTESNQWGKKFLDALLSYFRKGTK